MEVVAPPEASTSAPVVKTEVEAPKKVITPRKKATTTKSKVKKEEDDGLASPDEFNEMAVDDRIDLAELNFPGGPVSSHRKNDRLVG